MSPRAFAALMDVHTEQEERRRMEADYRAGVIAAELRNKPVPFMTGSSAAVRPDHWFPSLSGLRREQTPEEMYAAFMTHVAALEARRGLEV